MTEHQELVAGFYFALIAPVALMVAIGLLAHVVSWLSGWQRIK